MDSIAETIGTKSPKEKSDKKSDESKKDHVVRRFNRRDLLKFGLGLSLFSFTKKRAIAGPLNPPPLPESTLTKNQSSAESQESKEVIWRKTTEEEQYLWQLVDRQHLLPLDFKADTIELLDCDVPVRERNPHAQASRFVIEDLKAMIDKAESQGIYLTVASAERTIETQRSLYEQDPSNPKRVPPGASQHHLGTAIDFTAASIGNEVNEQFTRTPQYTFLQEQAHQFGFVQSYLEGHSHDGVPAESWHYQYVGRPLASSFQQLRDSGADNDIFDVFQAINHHQFKIPVVVENDQEHIDLAALLNISGIEDSSTNITAPTLERKSPLPGIRFNSIHEVS